MGSDNGISYWISAIKNDGLARKIIHCAPFSRIRGVSFLGAIDSSKSASDRYKAT